MKKKKEMLPEAKEEKREPGTDPVNKFKKGQHTTAAEIDNIIKGSVENVKPQAGSGFTDDGSVSVYGDES